MEQDADFQRIATIYIENRFQAQVFDADGWRGFQPDGLPDAGGTVVVNPARSAVDSLLAARLVGVLRIFGAHDDPVDSSVEVRGDVEEERNVAALIVSHLLSIHPDGCFIIHCAE